MAVALDHAGAQGTRRVKKVGVKHTPMASAGARAYNGGQGRSPSGGPGGRAPGIFLENWNWGCNKILGCPPFPFLLLLSPSPVFLSLSSPSLRSRPPLIQPEGLGERCKLPSGVWGGAPAENDFDAF